MGRQRRRARRGAWGVWARPGSEVAALVATALVGVIAALGWLADAVEGAGSWWRLGLFAAGVLALGMGAATLLRGWLAARRWLARRAAALPAAAALAVAGLALWLASGPAFHARLTSLRTLVGGRAETERLTLAHQVYANYRRADLAALTRVLERARVYEPTVREAAATFGVDVEVLMGVGAAESAFYPHDSADGGRGLFQITAPPAEAVSEVRRRLGVAELDALNQRHNAFLAAATLRRYLDEMHGDLFLGLLAYNIGPRNGGLRAIMEQYGARDFATIQPYLNTLPRDYPIRVLSAALAYRLWRTEGRLPRYEDGANAQHIQSVGVPGLTVARG
ncbi:MAG TPA: transglycosylase SLT domain-containing protein [Verrucomicrobiae bacterium]|nr:transglycosylase SLT domain-containing protein [Verrucomicrobiae bacterium]